MTQSSVSQNSTAGIILSAGMSARMKHTKQLLRIEDQFLIERVLGAAIQSKLSAIYLVLGHNARKIMTTLGKTIQDNHIHVVINPEFEQGLSRSLYRGLQKAEKNYSSVMFLLGDQPMLDSNTIDLLLDQFKDSGKDICAPVYQGKRGNPVIFSRNMYTALKSIKGDTGARTIIRENPDRVHLVEIDNPLCFFDIDTQQDYRAIKKIISELK